MRKYANFHDTCACLVWIPDLDPSKHIMLSADTRYMYLLFTDIVGLTVRHITRELAPIFSLQYVLTVVLCMNLIVYISGMFYVMFLPPV